MGSVIHSYVTNSMVKGVWLDIRKFELVVRGMTGARFGVRAEAAVHCDAEQLREAIDAWQAIVAIELSRISPQ